MGRYVSDYIKNKERREWRSRAISKRRATDPITNRQYEFLVDLGRQLCMDAETTLAYIREHYVLEFARAEVTCYLDLRRSEASFAIAQLKAKLDD